MTPTEHYLWCSPWTLLALIHFGEVTATKEIENDLWRQVNDKLH
jgi:hypothetical protein